MALGPGLVLFSAVVFAGIGLAYLIAPGAMLSVVGIESGATVDFLMRTEGVALLTGGWLLWAARDARPRQLMVVLVALALYYILGSLVDLAAYRDAIVGAASVPSAVIRIAFGTVSLAAAWRLWRS